MNINAKRAAYFKHHPTKKEFYFTSDDQAYHTQNGAEDHAKILKSIKKKSDQVDHITREMVEAWENGGSEPGAENGNTAEVVNTDGAKTGSAPAPETDKDGDNGAGAPAGDNYTAPVINDTDSDEVKAAKQAVIEAIEALNASKKVRAKQPANTGAPKVQAAEEMIAQCKSDCDAAIAALNELVPPAV